MELLDLKVSIDKLVEAFADNSADEEVFLKNTSTGEVIEIEGLSIDGDNKVYLEFNEDSLVDTE